MITPDTLNEQLPWDWSRCSFAVTFHDGKKLKSVFQYLNDVLAYLRAQQAQRAASGSLRPVIVPGIIATQGETFYYTTQATIFAKHTFTTYQGASQGISFRIMRGVYYRIGGSRGRATPQSVIEPDDHGILVISNLRLLFMGTARTVDVPLRQVAGITPLSDGVRVGLSNGKTLQFATGDAVAGPMLERMCTNPP